MINDYTMREQKKQKECSKCIRDKGGVEMSVIDNNFDLHLESDYKL